MGVAAFNARFAAVKCRSVAEANTGAALIELASLPEPVLQPAKVVWSAVPSFPKTLPVPPPG